MWDDLSCELLPPGKVAEARSEEVKVMNQRGVWEFRTEAECWEKTGKAPVSMRWVDVNKGGKDRMEVRSRMVVRDFKGNYKDRDDLFAETTPLEAERLLMSRAATRLKDGSFRKLMFIDVKKAYINSECKDDVYVSLPKEAGCPEGMCGKLNYWIYGFRKVASAWENHYSGKLESAGFIRGESCGVVFYHPERESETSLRRK